MAQRPNNNKQQLKSPTTTTMTTAQRPNNSTINSSKAQQPYLRDEQYLQLSIDGMYCQRIIYYLQKNKGTIIQKKQHA
jgi:hypothetical protein